MKTTINKKVYNTETAKLLGVVYNNGIAERNGMYNTIFYQTKKGQIFYWYNAKLYLDTYNYFQRCIDLFSHNTLSFMMDNQIFSPFIELIKNN